MNKKEAFVVLHINDVANLSCDNTNWTQLALHDYIAVYLTYDDFIEDNFTVRFRLDKSNGYSMINLFLELEGLKRNGYTITFLLQNYETHKVEEADRLKKRKGDGDDVQG